MPVVPGGRGEGRRPMRWGIQVGDCWASFVGPNETDAGSAGAKRACAHQSWVRRLMAKTRYRGIRRRPDDVRLGELYGKTLVSETLLSQARCGFLGEAAPRSVSSGSAWVRDRRLVPCRCVAVACGEERTAPGPSPGAAIGAARTLTAADGVHGTGGGLARHEGRGRDVDAAGAWSLPRPSPSTGIAVHVGVASAAWLRWRMPPCG